MVLQPVVLKCAGSNPLQGLGAMHQQQEAKSTSVLQPVIPSSESKAPDTPHAAATDTIPLGSAAYGFQALYAILLCWGRDPCDGNRRQNPPWRCSL